MVNTLAQVIEVNEDNCVNCHACISACPIKFCIDGSGNTVSINHNLCIGCGKCIQACTHDARRVKDDFSEFLQDIGNKRDLVAFVAPAAAAVFEGKYLELNTWLKSIGIKAVFDVSFGAELTVRSYLNHIKENKPPLVIAQPCPAIVTYIELYKKELLPYLAPADSPMLHTVHMIKEYYPQYKDCRIVAISPCVAKKREFEETNLDILNVTMISIKKYLAEKGIKLSNFSKTDFDDPPAERAVSFSTPGGLLETAKRELPGVENLSRKIEGPDIIYHYLNNLPESLKKGTNPLLIDCLNCEEGCNGGPGTKDASFERIKTQDELEYFVTQRSKAMIKKYNQDKRGASFIRGKRKLDKHINSYWKNGLYARTYKDLSGNNTIRMPSKEEVKEIYTSMYKFSEKDIINCCACGYNSCEMMATAIFNGLNKRENCTYYREKVIENQRNVLKENSNLLNQKLETVTNSVGEIAGTVEEFLCATEEKTQSLAHSTDTLESMVRSIQEIVRTTETRQEVVESIGVKAKDAELSVLDTMNALGLVVESLGSVTEIARIIKENDSNTAFLSFNATIEAAHAGAAGKGFAVVAEEIGRLAETSSENVKNISKMLDVISKQILESKNVAEKTTESVKEMIPCVGEITALIREVVDKMNELGSESNSVSISVASFKELSELVSVKTGNIANSIESISESVSEIYRLSDTSNSIS